MEGEEAFARRHNVSVNALRIAWQAYTAFSNLGTGLPVPRGYDDRDLPRLTWTWTRRDGALTASITHNLLRHTWRWRVWSGDGVVHLDETTEDLRHLSALTELVAPWSQS